MLRTNPSNKKKELLNNKGTGIGFLDNTGDLGKIKRLVLLPNTELMTTKMVADWFEVSQEVIRDNIRRNRVELETNGMVMYSYADIKRLIDRDIIGRKLVKELGINTAGRTNLFTLDSIVLLSFLIRKSSVAKMVRCAVSKNESLMKKFNDYLLRLDNSYVKENGVYNHLSEAFQGLFKIEREVVCDNFYIDIVISNGSRRLAVEVDEYGHTNYSKNAEKNREKFIVKNGYKIVRFNPDCNRENSVITLINTVLLYFYGR